MSFWIPNVDARELPGTRELHLQLSNQENASVHLVIPEAQLGAARFWVLRNGGRPHPQHEGLFIASIDVRYDYPKEFANEIQSKIRSLGTINSYLIAVKSFARYLADIEVLQRNPLKIHSPMVQKRF